MSFNKLLTNMCRYTEIFRLENKTNQCEHKTKVNKHELSFILTVFVSV